jgi:putative mRNA 3-end processing factor
MTPVLEATQRGLYCPVGRFYIDPTRGVELAIVTHAHADHARQGSVRYLAATPGAGILRARLGAAARIDSVAYGEIVNLNGVRVSLHPAGHILGSAQVRLERGGEVWVVSGDYKLGVDPTCQAFEPVPCHVFVTESTFGLPIYQWRPSSEVYGEIRVWWEGNQRDGAVSVMFAYSLGKAQRLLAGLGELVGPCFVHEAVAKMTDFYREAGVLLPPVQVLRDKTAAAELKGALIIGPPGWSGLDLDAKQGPVRAACASGWMQTRQRRSAEGLDRGFVLSDHADWPGLLKAVRDTGADRVWVNHGFCETLARWLNENGWTASVAGPRVAESGDGS